MFGNISSTEVLVIAIALLVLFGGQKLPELARGLGESAKEIKKAKKEFKKALDEDDKD